VILVDANLLIYAVNKDLPQHKRARAWLEASLSGAGEVGLPWVSLLAFLRICTNPTRISPRWLWMHDLFRRQSRFPGVTGRP
jgi:predicted nucleic acid-binding protein